MTYYSIIKRNEAISLGCFCSLVAVSTPGDWAWTGLQKDQQPHVASMSHPSEVRADLPAQPNLWKSAQTGPDQQNSPANPWTWLGRNNNRFKLLKFVFLCSHSWLIQVYLFHVVYGFSLHDFDYIQLDNLLFFTLYPKWYMIHGFFNEHPLFVCLLIFVILGPYWWHMEVPRLGVQLELCYGHSKARSELCLWPHWESTGIELASSWILSGSLLLSHNRNSRAFLFLFGFGLLFQDELSLD